jgi:hypothetical protein
MLPITTKFPALNASRVGEDDWDRWLLLTSIVGRYSTENEIFKQDPRRSLLASYEKPGNFFGTRSYIQELMYPIKL